MNSVHHSIIAQHELSEHARVVVLGTETQATMAVGLNGVQAILALLNANTGISPLLRINLLGAAGVLVEHLRNVASGAGFDAYAVPPDDANELLELAEKLREAQ